MDYILFVFFFILKIVKEYVSGLIIYLCLYVLISYVFIFVCIHFQSTILKIW